MFANYVFHKIDLNSFDFKYNLIKNYWGSNLFLVLSLGSNKFLAPGATNSGRIFTVVFKKWIPPFEKFWSIYKCITVKKNIVNVCFSSKRHLCEVLRSPFHDCAALHTTVYSIEFKLIMIDGIKCCNINFFWLVLKAYLWTINNSIAWGFVLWQLMNNHSCLQNYNLIFSI